MPRWFPQLYDINGIDAIGHIIHNGIDIEFTIDACDVELAKQHRWTIIDSYIYSTRPRIALSRHLFGLARSNKLQVDHIDGNRLNNKRNNLRIVTNQQNCMNRGMRNNNYSGLRGVDYDRKGCCWRSRYTYQGVTYFLGNFDSAEDAHRKYIESTREVFGRYFRPCSADCTVCGE